MVGKSLVGRKTMFRLLIHDDFVGINSTLINYTNYWLVGCNCCLCAAFSLELLCRLDQARVRALLEVLLSSGSRIFYCAAPRKLLISSHDYPMILSYHERKLGSLSSRGTQGTHHWMCLVCHPVLPLRVWSRQWFMVAPQCPLTRRCSRTD